MTAEGRGPALPPDREDLERLLHQVSNLVAAIYTYGEPAKETGEGMREALEEILAAGVRLEELLREWKRALREEEEG